jgi:prevent-host-death family protein
MSKTITLTEAKIHLSHYARLCQQEPVIVTVKGVPTFQLVPVDDEDDFLNQLLERNPAFRELLESRRNGETISAEEAMRSL